MINADVLTFQEFAMHETLPLSKIQETILGFLQGREDVALFGAQAVNAYVSEPRMTQDVDILSVNAAGFAEELRQHLSDKFHIAVRIREIGDKGFRIYQLRNEGNRHLADVRAIDQMPETERIENLLVLSPAELIASKVVSYHSRRGKPKSGTDWRDLAELLLRFPELKTQAGQVSDILRKGDNAVGITEVWNDVVSQDLTFEGDDEDLNF